MNQNSSIGDWLEQKLHTMSDETFCAANHRIQPEFTKQNTRVRFFSVPLASGLGSAVFAEPKVPTRSKPVLVILLHGLGDDCTYPHWHWIQTLVSQGISVFSVDWDGHGLRNSTMLDFQYATRSLPLLLQKIFGPVGEQMVEKPKGAPDCYLMGHSAGAVLSLLAVTRTDIAKIIKAVVAVSPAVTLNPESAFSHELLSYVSPFAWFKDFAPSVSYYGFRGLFPATGQFKRDQFPLRMNVGIEYIEQLRWFISETFKTRNVLELVKVPVFWLHGRKDKIAPFAEVHQLMNQIRSGLLSFCDHERGHLRMAFSQTVPELAATFINRFQSLE